MRLRRSNVGLILAVLQAGITGCGEKTVAISDQTGVDRPLSPGAPVEIELKAAFAGDLEPKVNALDDWTPSDLFDAYPVEFETLNFNPLDAANYDLIQSSKLALTTDEQALFEAHGFVIAKDTVPTFSYGYHTIYAQDLPVYISADSALDALHRSYDDILKELEEETLIPTLRQYLVKMREQLACCADLPEEVINDVDFFLAVPYSLLSGSKAKAAVAGSFDIGLLEMFLEGIDKAAGLEQVNLFSVSREIDFSQFTPRGHYTDSPELTQYFQAMMWLGRIELRLIETQADGQRVLNRRQVEAMLGLHSLMQSDEVLAPWRTIDRVVTGFVGEHDYMTVLQVDELLQSLEIAGVDELPTVPDGQLAQTIIDGAYGTQRILSHFMLNDGSIETLPLDASFALFGQRYVVDSHVFSQVVFDRVQGRYLPDPLDVAFAALRNNQAATLLRPQLDEFDYAAKLGRMRLLVDEHPDDSWDGSLYTLWLRALQTLSPVASTRDEAEQDNTLPNVMRTEAWGRRLLQTQLASWAQLRHDTLLYAKQSYTSSDECDYPDAYVEPHPEFWQQLVNFADRGASILESLDLPDSSVVAKANAYFAKFREIVGTFHAIALQQQSGAALSEEQLAFVNQAVLIKNGGSGPPTIEGWYHQLIYNTSEFSDVDLTIADVHTDVGGAHGPPQVLHVGTAFPRLMTVAVETCDGARAYVGPVYAYREHTEVGSLKRLNDEEWTQLVSEERAKTEPSWLAPVVTPE